ncbi:MAG: MOSC domain-containing protein [Pseudomonadota bacterium]
MQTLDQLINAYAQPGQVTWIGLRPAKRAAMIEVDRAKVTLAGLEGDRKATPGKRAVTLLQAEHLPVIASLSGQNVDFTDLRRNIAVSGLNLIGLKGRTLRIGSATLRITGICAPCSRMEEALGKGGYAAVRGHGGMTAEVITPGHIALGDAVIPLA